MKLHLGAAIDQHSPSTSADHRQSAEGQPGLGLARAHKVLIEVRRPIRTILLALVTALVFAGCGGGLSGRTFDTDSGDAPVVSVDVQAELTVMAISAACGDLCTAQPLYIRDHLLDTDTLVGEEDPMPQVIRAAVSDAYPDATWVDLAGADAISNEADDGRAVLVAVSPLIELASNVQGVEVGITHEAFHGQIIQFQWAGTEWVQVNSDDTGVTVTSVVS